MIIDGQVTLTIYPQNWLAVEIQQQLKMDIQVTMGGVVRTGYNPIQVTQLMDAHEVPQNERVDLLKRIRVMEVITCNELNK